MSLDDVIGIISIFMMSSCRIAFFSLVCLSMLILYFNAAKFSIKLFSFIYFTVSVVIQRDTHEIVTETQPIKNT